MDTTRLQEILDLIKEASEKITELTQEIQSLKEENEALRAQLNTTSTKTVKQEFGEIYEGEKSASDAKSWFAQMRLNNNF